jgi:hypothetical protein
MYVLKTECYLTLGTRCSRSPGRETEHIPATAWPTARALAADVLLEVWEDGGVLVSRLRR